MVPSMEKATVPVAALPSTDVGETEAERETASWYGVAAIEPRVRVVAAGAMVKERETGSAAA